VAGAAGSKAAVCNMDVIERLQTARQLA
jgi:hypothetical protein